MILRRRTELSQIILANRMHKKERLHHIEAAGGVVYRLQGSRVDVLLIYRNGFWDIPKGKREEGESIELCAIREVSEEVGVEPPIIESDLGITKHQYEQKGKLFDKTTYWYTMVLSQEVASFTPQLEEGIEKVEWVALEEAIELVAFENLVDVLVRFRKSIEP